MGCATGGPKSDSHLLGEWKCASAIVDGNPLPQKTADLLHLTLTKDRYITKKGDEVLFDSVYRVDASSKPHRIFMVGTEGALTGKEAGGIYKVDGHSLTLCYSMPGDPVPTNFTSSAGSKAYLITWNRAQ